MKTFFGILVRAVAMMVLVSVTGCMGGRHPWTAAPVQGPGLVIAPTDTYSQGRLLFVKTTFTNQSTAPMTVNRDGAQLVMPDGHVVARSLGAYTQHTPYVILPGASHAVWVDFRADSWNWADVHGAQVNWSGAVTINGQPLAVPLMALASQ